MTALTANRDLGHLTSQELRQLQVGAAETIYKGSIVGIDPGGYAKPFVVCDRYAGIAYGAVDNSAGAAAAKQVDVYCHGDFELPISGVAILDAGKPVFATDDGSFAMLGHPDAWVGNIVHYSKSGYGVVRLREPHHIWTPEVGGAFEIREDCLRYLEEPGAAGGDAEFVRGPVLLSTALGLGVTNIGAEGNGWNLDFDAVDEIAHASCETKAYFPVDQGITFEIDMYVPTAGIGPATLDIDFGLGSALATATRVDMGGVVQAALFHVDGAATTLSARSDNNTTDTGNVDTTGDVSGTAYGKYKVIARKGGTVEFWQNGIRLLSTTAFAVLSTADLAGFINAEKTGTATLSDVYFRNFRVAGGKAA